MLHRSRKKLNFATLLARRLNISKNSHMGIIQYAEQPKLEISLYQYSQINEIEWAIQRIKYLSGATNTGAALKFALDEGFKDASGGDIPKVLVVLSDGQSQDDVSEPAQLLRDAHVMVYAIGVTNLINVHQLYQIAGNPLRVLTVESFYELDKPLVDSLTWDMCKTEYRPGTPDIICAPDHIGVRAATKKPFDGYVFVMDHFHEPECRAGPEMFPDPKSIGITVPFSDCNIHRYRSLNPRGIFVEMTVVFMFHNVFMTKVDQTVKVQCFYMEAEKTVTAPLAVSMLATEFREKVYEMPRCQYTLRRGSKDGPIAKYASLGENIFHRWECFDDSDAYGMLIHSCYVDNGFGDKVDILDHNGCGVDAVLLSTPDYDSSLRLATKPYHVFKYADQPVLQFQCQVTLCFKYDGGCDTITPPNCSRAAPESYLRVYETRSRRAIQEIDTFDLFTGKLQIVEHLPECIISESKKHSSKLFLYVIITTANLLLFLISGTLFFRQFFRQRFS
uniref:ZP domain-containing protein n=1 Tax=Syphacia muris TaxID=451379 RepID=A0A0N5AFP9_9BILA